MVAKISKGRGKTAFITDYLKSHPTANAKALKEAWSAAGNDGTVSVTLVQKARTRLGLIGNIPRGVSPAAKSFVADSDSAPKKRGRKPGSKNKKKLSHAESNGSSAPPASSSSSSSSRRGDSYSRAIEDAEADIDRVIFQLMAVSGLEEIEVSLRDVRRRLVVLGHQA